MSDKKEKKREIRPPSMVDALIPIVSLIILLGGAILICGDEATGFAIDTGYQGLDSLFTRGGMASMLGTVWLIISFVYAAFGFQIRHLDPQEEREPHPQQVALYGVGNRRSEPTTPEAAMPAAS